MFVAFRRCSLKMYRERLSAKLGEVPFYGTKRDCLRTSSPKMALR